MAATRRVSVLNLGLTGGIGSGKSAASAVLESLGATIVDADRIAREVVAPDTEGLAQIVDAFGRDVLSPDGALDRAALAAVVFTDEPSRHRLNTIVHPLVRARSEELIAAAGADAVVINDIPLLAEGSMAPSFHLVLVVHAPEEVRLQRLVESRGMNRDDANARIAAQATDEQRAAIADVVLDNSGTPRDLAAQIERLWADRITPFSAALEMGVAAVDRLIPRDGAIEREQSRVDFALRDCGLVVEHGPQRTIVRGEAEIARDLLRQAAYFGSTVLQSADPGAVGAVELIGV